MKSFDWMVSGFKAGFMLLLLGAFFVTGCSGGGGGSSNDTGSPGGTTTITGTVYPTVLSKSTDGSSGAVDTGAAISVTFSKGMDASTINTSTFILYQGTVYLGCNGATTSTGTTSISGAVTYDAAAKKAIFTPTQSLSYNTTYNAQVGCVKDSAGNALANSFSWSFTTKQYPTSTNPYLMGGAIQGNPLSPYTDVVSTIAGLAGSQGSTDGTNSAARFYMPWEITTDGTNLYVADASNNTIRKIVISTGVVTTIAGTAGVSGSTDGTGLAARFHSPYGITTDGTNLYVADRGNNTIRKIVISTGVVTTLAGSAGSSGSTDGTATSARFYFPKDIATDGTNLFIADSWNHTIRKVVVSTGVVTTLAGSAGFSGWTDGTATSATFHFPEGITTDGTNLFVADTQNSRIRKIVITTGAVTTIAGTGSCGSTDGTGSTARFCVPYGITTDGTNLYVADTANYTIRKIVIATGVVSTIAGTAGVSGSMDGIGSVARFLSPNGITNDGTNLYVADSVNNTIRKISARTTAPSSAPSGLTSTVGDGQMTLSWSSVADATCYNLYCAEGTSVTTTTGTKIPYIASPYQLGGYWTATPIVITNGTTYSCIVTAVNNYGEGPASSPISATPAASHTLSISKSGAGSGTVTSTPSGIDCGSTCSASVTSGSTMTLTATAASGSTFSGWSGACSGTGSCTVTMDSNKTATATFTPSTLTLSVSKSGTGSGTVTSSPSGISCGSTCSSSFTNGSSVTLTATAASGSTFSGWSGACSGTGSCTVTMSSDKSVTATFTTSTSSSTYYWANWSCGSSSQCASVMGGTSGSTGPMCTQNDCNSWKSIYFAGASCLTTATYTKVTGPMANGVCAQSGVDF